MIIWPLHTCHAKRTWKLDPAQIPSHDSALQLQQAQIFVLLKCMYSCIMYLCMCWCIVLCRAVYCYVMSCYVNCVAYVASMYWGVYFIGKFLHLSKPLCLYACMPVCLYGCMPVRLYVSIPVCLPVCLFVWMDGWVDGCMYVCLCMSVFVCVCLCKSVYVCVCVCMSVYVCMYGMVWFGMVWYGIVFYCILLYCIVLYVCMYVGAYVRMCGRLYLCMCVDMYVYICIKIDTAWRWVCPWALLLVQVTSRPLLAVLETNVKVLQLGILDTDVGWPVCPKAVRQHCAAAGRLPKEYNFIYNVQYITILYIYMSNIVVVGD